MPLEDLVLEARLHLSGWTSRESAFAPRAQLDLPITSRIQRPEPRPGVTVNRNGEEGVCGGEPAMFRLLSLPPL